MMESRVRETNKISGQIKRTLEIDLFSASSLYSLARTELPKFQQSTQLANESDRLMLDRVGIDSRL